jgi:hypothetical protein
VPVGRRPRFESATRLGVPGALVTVADRDLDRAVKERAEQLAGRRLKPTARRLLTKE